MANSSVKIELNVAVKEAQKSLQAIEKQVKTTNLAFSSFLGNLASTAAAGAIKGLASAVTSSIGGIVDTARSAEDLLNGMNVALANSGLYSEQTSKRFQDLSSEIEAVTVHSSNLIQQQAGVLASSTKLNEDGIERSIRAASELSAIYNIDLKQATQLLSDAYNGKTERLKKLGLEFVATGSKAGDYASILSVIEEREGTAEKRAQSFEGGLGKLNNQLSNNAAALGYLVTQNPLVVAGIQMAADALGVLAVKLTAATEWVNKHQDAMEVLAVGLGLTSVALVAVAAKAAIASTAFGALAAAASAAWAAVTAPISLVVIGIAAVGTAVFAIVKYWDDVKAAAYDALAATLEFAAKGAAALGRSGTSEALKEQAAQYRDVAKAARETAQASRDAEKEKTDALKLENNTRRKMLDEEEIRQQEELNKYVQRLAAQGEDIKSQQRRQLEELKLFHENKNLIEEEAEVINFESKLQREAEYFEARKDILDQNLESDLARVEQSTAAEAFKHEARLELERQYFVESLKLETDHAKKVADIQKKQAAQDRYFAELKVSTTMQMFGSLSDLASVFGKQAFEVTRALAIGESVTAGILAVQKALASAPPPFNYAVATAMGIRTAANTARIAQQRAPAFESGGIVPGNSFTGDNVMARVNSGEMILNRQQQKNLFDMAQGGGSSRTESLLVQLIQAVRSSTSISIDGREIISVVRDGLSDGRALA